MKKYLLLLLLIPYLGISQEKNQIIIQLENSKANLIKTISQINDSIDKIDYRISSIKSEFIENKISKSSYIAIARKGAKLKKTPEAMKGEVILTLLEDRNVAILDYHNEYFGVCIGEKCGYMSELWINKDESLKEFIKQKRFEEDEFRKIELERNLKLHESESANLEKKYNSRFGKLAYSKLKKGLIWVGMTKEMAIISRGNPEDINRTIYSWAVKEQWVYKNYYLYFENGILTAIQD